jgi:hypothetical protein
MGRWSTTHILQPDAEALIRWTERSASKVSAPTPPPPVTDNVKDNGGAPLSLITPKL